MMNLRLKIPRIKLESRRERLFLRWVLNVIFIFGMIGSAGLIALSDTMKVRIFYATLMSIFALALMMEVSEA